MGWQLLGKVTGLSAWVVCLGHLSLSCWFKRTGAKDPSQDVSQDEANPEKDLEEAPSSPLKAIPPSVGENPFGDDAPAELPEEPTQQWNDAGAKPFGST